jgi:hypothetical protein
MMNLTLIQNYRGPFGSSLISRVYAVHLQTLGVSKYSVTNAYGYQIGALALAAAAVR